jgi:hypothetical protein
MLGRSTSFRIILLVVAASFVVLSCVAGGHLHEATATGTLKPECQLCSLGQVRAHASGAGPALIGLILLAWLIIEPPAEAPVLRALCLLSPRAPPAR